jgi:glycosyltransferase involved in cell wall biosynthesis
VIPNGYDEDDFQGEVSPEKDFFTIAYTGTMTLQYRPQTFFKAIHALSEANPGKVKFIIAGSPDPDVIKAAEMSGIKSLTEFKGYLSHTESVEIMRKAAVLYLSIPDVEKNKGILTGKLFEYLASQRPIICTGPKDGDAARIIAECVGGVVMGYDDVEALEKFLQKQFELWKEKKISNVIKDEYKKYSRKNLTASLAEIL